MPFPAIGVTFDSAEACVGDCCTTPCPDAVGAVSLAGDDLYATFECADCSTCCQDVGTCLFPCYPGGQMTGTLVNDGVGANQWVMGSTSSGCCTGCPMTFRCVGDSYEFSFSSGACSDPICIKLPATLISITTFPLVMVFTMGTGPFSECGSAPGDPTNCEDCDQLITVTISETP